MLEQYYSKGMKSKAQKDLICEVAQKMGRPSGVIQNWISNRARKGKGQNNQPRSSKPSGFNIFCRENPVGGGGDHMKIWVEKWKVADQGQYNKRANEMKERTEQELSSEERKSVIQSSMKTMAKQSTQLEKLGLKVMFVVLGGEEERYTGGDETGRDFLIKSDTLLRFISHCDQFASAPGTKTERKELRKQAQNKLNTKYSDFIGEPGARFPLIQYTAGETTFEVKGLPFNLKPISHYGRLQLNQLIDSLDDITFQPKAPATEDENLVLHLSADSVDHEIDDEEMTGSFEIEILPDPAPVAAYNADEQPTTTYSIDQLPQDVTHAREKFYSKSNTPEEPMITQNTTDEPNTTQNTPEEPMITQNTTDEPNTTQQKPPRKRIFTARTPWTEEENKLFYTTFASDIAQNSMPAGEKVKKLAESLPKRSTSTIRTRINNMIHGKQKIRTG